MPRTPRGGSRAGTPGTAYAQRTDLNRERTLPVRAAPGQTYGQAQAQTEAQRLVPMAAPSVPLPSGMPAAPQAAPQAPQAPGMAPIAPGQFGALTRPTERPLEPVTAGIASGPGPGPEVLPQASQMTGTNLSSTLAQIAQQSGSQAIRALAQHAASAGT